MSEAPYPLLPEDIEYLEGNYPFWNCIPYRTGNCLVIYNFPTPFAYIPNDPDGSDMLIVIPQGYLGTKIDMFHFSPKLKKTDGVPIGHSNSFGILGRAWQRWSRHYNWVPGEDTIVSHIEFIKNSLQNKIVQ